MKRSPPTLQLDVID
jgi:hypothetical protein